MSQSMVDQRVLVIGASSGIGRSTGLMLAAEGARVAFAARRAELLDETAADAGAGAVTVLCDVRDPEQCESAVARTVERFGGLDALVYATGIYPWTKLVDSDAETWRRVLETNLIGASLATRAAIGPLEASPRGRAVYLSSISGTLTPPWLGIGPYGVSKAGLERLVDSWRVEYPEIGFTNIIVGNTNPPDQGETSTAPSSPPAPSSPTSPASRASEDEPLVAEIMQRWTQKGYFSGEFMHSDGVAEQVLHALTSREQVWELKVLGRGWSLG